MNAQLKLSPLLTTILTIFAACSFGAGSQSDYDRAEKLAERFRNKVFRSDLEAHWQTNNTSFWYKVQTDANSHEFILVHADKGTRQLAFDHDRLAKSLHASGVENVDAKSLTIQKLKFDFDAHNLEFEGYGKIWTCNLDTYQLTVVSEKPVQSLPAYEPDHAPKPPRRNGKQVTLTFFNDTSKTVEIFWIDAYGDKNSYGKIKSKQERSQHTLAGHLWLVSDLDSTPLAVYQAEEGKCKAVIGIETIKVKPAQRRPKNKPAAMPSPCGTWEAFTKNNNLWLRNLKTTEETALSNDGTEDNTYTQRIFWSPDSRKLVVIQTQKAPPHMIHMVESSPADQIQPKLHSINYHKPGDVLDIDQPRLFDIATARQIPIDKSLFDNPWSISELRWKPDSSRFSFLYNQRGHQVLRLIGVDSQSGTAKTLLEETSETFIHYSGKLFYETIDKDSEFIWMSERDGWNHLYLYDSNTGQLKNQITQGDWLVRHVDKVDPDKRQIWFQAGGIRPEQDPYYIHVCRVNFDGTGLTVLTEGNGTHTVTFSPDRAYFVDTYSRIDMPSIHELRRSDNGKLVCQLEKADWSELLNTGWQVPEPFVAKGRDGVTDIYGMILRPTNFDPHKRYPVIEDIYASPHSSFVPKSFRDFYHMSKLAELGFIIVKIDGMGTSNRSKKFHDVCWQNLSDSGFDDRIKWIQAAAAKYPYMDISRVGIYGGSAGGQSAATAVMTHGHFYKAAVADCGCYDNRMDKVWWNEQWMGWPVGAHYESNSVVTLAKQLQGKLLLTVGELDKNVDPASTMQVVNALIKADKDFDMLVVPGGGHGAGNGKYGARRRADYFVRHLLGVEPRHTP